MSRLTELITRIKAKDSQLGLELEKEFKVLSSRRQFGLNFERHTPENVELPNREVRKGDKVRVLPERGSTSQGDQRLWIVKGITKNKGRRIATIELIQKKESERLEKDVSDLIVVAEFQDYIYPGLASTGKVEQGGNKPYHTVINGENYHALKALTFTHKGKIDAIYIDPPYNTGAKDWKYNNDYVESEDLYRHSKWLAFMERRLLLASKLLNPSNSVLIVTIDEKEYLRLGLLLEQTFPGANIQMVISVINPKGSARDGRFSRVEEYIYFVFFGESSIKPWRTDMLREVQVKERSVRWAGLIRNGEGSRRSRIPSMFYPIYIDKESGLFHSVGNPPALSVKPENVQPPKGTVALWPIDGSGNELMWRLNPASFLEYFHLGHAKFGRRDSSTGLRPVYYLQKGIRKQLENGQVIAVGRTDEGALELKFADSLGTRSPATTWNMVSHSASEYGAGILKLMVPNRRFPYPKSLYAVEDCLRFVLAENKNAVVLDFFAGSGTTAHAVMRLNRQDNGLRQCISVTNNEVSADEQKSLRKKGFRQGDEEWEKLGICDFITKPRLKAAITGLTPSGSSIEGEYKFTDQFPISEGFNENAEFFTLTYHTPLSISHNLAFRQVAPLLWMRSGSQGKRITEVPKGGWALADTYGLLIDLDKSAEFVKAISASTSLKQVYIVTNDDRRFQSIVKHLPSGIEPVRLYESYLKNFQFTSEL